MSIILLVMFTGQISQLNIANPATLQLLGYDMLMNNQYDEALKYFQTNVLHYPDCIQAYIDLAEALLDKAGTRLGNFNKAIEILNIALEIDPNNALVCKILSEAYLNQSDFEKAYKYAQKAYDLSPNQVTFVINYANNLKFMGELVLAAGLYRRVINSDPNNIYAYYNLFLIEKVDADMPEFKQCEWLAANDNDFDIDKQIYLYFTLSKAYADLKDYQKSFEYLTKGNNLKHQTFNDYHVKKDIGAFHALKKTFTEEILKSELASIYNAYNSDNHLLVKELLGLDLKDYPTPVFVLGMPRTGSTLVEQILSAHSIVYGGGELNYLRQACSGIYVNDAQSLLKQFNFAELKRRAKDYMEAIKILAKGSSIVTDKMPSNFAYIGFIKLMLPHAKIIHTRRDPMATCFSCYKQLFEYSHPYSFDLNDLGAYYRSYDDLMKHYCDLFKNDKNLILEINYEDLVTDQALYTNTMLDYCGLNFEQSCLDFHTSKRIVNTASLVQVRKPIYSSSKSEWEDYKNYLPLLYQALAISP